MYSSGNCTFPVSHFCQHNPKNKLHHVNSKVAFSPISCYLICCKRNTNYQTVGDPCPCTCCHMPKRVAIICEHWPLHLCNFRLGLLVRNTCELATSHASSEVCRYITNVYCDKSIYCAPHVYTCHILREQTFYCVDASVLSKLRNASDKCSSVIIKSWSLSMSRFSTVCNSLLTVSSTTSNGTASL